MEQTHFFAEYTMQGVKPDVPYENQIFLELEPDRLAKTLNALKSSNSARSLKIKLTRKHDSPCLSFEIDLAPSASMSTVSSTTSINSFAVSRTCTHDVPVTLIPRRHWPDFREPDMPAFDVSITMPDLKQMKHLMERYKNFGQHLTIQANREGKLQLKFESDQLSVVTHYKDLDNPSRGNSHGSQEKSSDHFVSVRVDLKRFTQFLALEQVGPRKAIANLEEGRVVHMFLVHDDVVIQCFVPAVTD
jgi:HUS1 checkpoint protein